MGHEDKILVAVMAVFEQLARKEPDAAINALMEIATRSAIDR